MPALSTFGKRVRQLWHAADLALVGQRRERRMRMLASMVMVVVASTLLLAPPTLAAPRATHLYLLPVAVGALMAFRDEPLRLRYGISLFSLLLFVALAASNWRPTDLYALP